MNVQFSTLGKIVADNQGHLLHIKASTPHVGGDEYTGLASPKFGHDSVSFLLRHASVHKADGKVGLPHLFGEPFNLLLLVAEDYCLCDC